MTESPAIVRKVALGLALLAVAVVLSACGAGSYKVGKPYQINGQWYYPKVDYSYHERGVASWYGSQFHGKLTANGEVFDMGKVSAAHRTLPLPSVVRVTNLENGRSLVVRVNDRGPFARGRIIDLSQRAAELLGFAANGTAMVDVEIVVDQSYAVGLAAGGAKHPDFGPKPPDAAPSIEVTVENLGAGENETVSAGGSPPPYGGMTNISPEPQSPKLAAAGNQPLLPPEEQVAIVPVAGTPAIYIQAGAFALFDNANRMRARLAMMGHSARVTQVYITNRPMFRVRVGPLTSVQVADHTLEQMVAAGYSDAHIVLE